ncbi:MAG: cytochrome c family protein [Pirellulales bacterium]|nr:cytochrome c family protein [Pirellulales bacterium]
MTKCHRSRTSRAVRISFILCAPCVVLLTIAGAGAEFAASDAQSGLGRPRATLDLTERQPRRKFIAEHVVGPLECRNCHQAEYEHWKQTKHAGRAFDLLRTQSTAREYAEALGIPLKEIARNSLCVRCHATPRVDEFGRPDVVPGVSCESCHNPAGGATGWLNSHAVYGPSGTRRETETAEHHSQRLAASIAAGKNGTDDLYSLARRCFQCHAVGEEALVNAGHSHGSRNFDFAEMFLSDLRHNFHLAQHVNASVSTLWLQQLHVKPGRTSAGRKRMMLVLGAVAELEVSLQNLSVATDEDGEYFESVADRVIDAFEYLTEDILDELSEVPPSLQRVVDIAQPFYKKIDDGDFSLATDATSCAEAAKAIADVAHKFARSSDGRELSELEEPGSHLP